MASGIVVYSTGNYTRTRKFGKKKMRLRETPQCLLLYFTCLVYNEAMQRDRQYWIRLIRFAAVALVVGLLTAYVGTAVLSGALYARALTHPGCGDTDTTPVDVGIVGTQDVTYPSHDEMILRAWYLPPRNSVVIILLPGLGGGRDGMLREGAILAQHGHGLLMTEMRSCVHPEGQTTLGYYEAKDLQEAVTWVLDQPGVEHVGVLGYSLGGITATLGSAEDERIEAMVAEVAGPEPQMAPKPVHAHTVAIASPPGSAPSQR